MDFTYEIPKRKYLCNFSIATNIYDTELSNKIKEKFCSLELSPNPDASYVIEISFDLKIYSIDKDKQAELARVLNERRSWFEQTISEYVETGLYPENARQNRPQDRVLMEQFMKQEGDDLRQGCLLVIFRIRNNLMHGLKCIEQLNDQLALFKAVNGVLESLDWKNC